MGSITSLIYPVDFSYMFLLGFLKSLRLGKYVVWPLWWQHELLPVFPPELCSWPQLLRLWLCNQPVPITWFPRMNQGVQVLDGRHQSQIIFYLSCALQSSYPTSPSWLIGVH